MKLKNNKKLNLFNLKKEINKLDNNIKKSNGFQLLLQQNFYKIMKTRNT